MWRRRRTPEEIVAEAWAEAFRDAVDRAVNAVPPAERTDAFKVVQLLAAQMPATVKVPDDISRLDT